MLLSVAIFRPEFQYKICYSKIFNSNELFKVNPVFQYKICYSKIQIHPLQPKYHYRFQYKICYSKINYTAIEEYDLKKFQYKICYSKMAESGFLNIIQGDFNTKFVIAKSFEILSSTSFSIISIQNLL